jgi:hypothetical protein
MEQGANAGDFTLDGARFSRSRAQPTLQVLSRGVMSCSPGIGPQQRSALKSVVRALALPASGSSHQFAALFILPSNPDSAYDESRFRPR